MSVRFVRRLFWTAGIFGTAAIAASIFSADQLAKASTPISHPEFFYGFNGIALAWQFMFLLIGSDPGRYRWAMLPAALEKFAFALPCAYYLVQGQLAHILVPFAAIDAILGVSFLIAHRSLRKSATPASLAGSEDAMLATDLPIRRKPSNYPPLFAQRMNGRTKRPLGDFFNLKNFGVNLTELKPDAVTALHHRHALQDELVYIVSGHPTLHVDGRKQQLWPGMVAGFSAGGVAHHIANETAENCLILEVGDRSANDVVSYPDDDLQAVRTSDGQWSMCHKDGSPY